jgi:hypothetical protein
VRADGGAEREPGRQGARQAGVPGAGHVAVEHAVRRGPAEPAREVHQEEGEVVAGVYRGQRFVELQSVVGRDLTAPEAKILQVQVAVAAPHPAG